MHPLISKIKKNKETIGVIGLGYVGLPLAVEFAKNNIKVIGFDIDLKKIETLKKGDNYINDIDSKDFIKALNNKINFSSDFTKLKLCDGILICVPTPLDIFKKPNMSFIKNACTLIAKHMSQHTFICLESTTYPTTTEDLILPIIEGESNYKHGDDFWLAFSPERVDPGNKIFKTNNTPKIIIPIRPIILLISAGTPNIKKLIIVDQSNCEY